MAKRVLIVDDSSIILMAARHVLVEAGFDVETRNGVEDLAAGSVSDFDLILMDVQMPQLCGDDVASILRNDRALQTPIYLFSTLPIDELAQRAKDARVDGFISKDLGMANLVGEVRRILDVR